MKIFTIVIAGGALIAGLYFFSPKSVPSRTVNITRPGDPGARAQDGEQFGSPVTNAIANAWSNLVSYTVRGIRNSNPGNLRLTSIPWEGKVPNDENTDGEFEQFYNAEDGIRAMARNLLTYYGRGLDTIEKIISTYAPDNENNTGAYIRSVEKFTGIDARRVYPSNKIRSLVKAIITHENGLNPYRDETITRAVQRAGWNA